ncbi:MAG: SRPBCC domain-containing protein [Armatimonadetes bacterium]|nr:SRPBCC domain-containing protein [Armatimonadota bacterium]
MTTVASENEIRSELMLKAPQEKVWWALTTQAGWTGWFSSGVEGTFAVGETLKLDFGPYGDAFARVVEMDPMTLFAYQWHAGDGSEIGTLPESELTTVRFTLEPVSEGTKLLMVESGFANIPSDRRFSALESNTSGWKSELAKMAPWVERDEHQPKAPYDIYRERFVKVPIQKAWDAVATPEGLKSWFVKDVEGDMSVGTMTIFHFQTCASGPVKVIERDEPNTISWLWHPGEKDGCTWNKYPEDQTTTVKFTFTEKNGGTEIVVTESGFDNIPEERRMMALGLNKGGWSTVMDWLRDYLTGKV